MDSIGAFLESQPFIALFLVVCLGYAVGMISIAGLSLGSGAVLFVGLAVGAIAPKAAPPGLIINSSGLLLAEDELGVRPLEFMTFQLYARLDTANNTCKGAR